MLFIFQNLKKYQKSPNPLTTLLLSSISIENKGVLCSMFIFFIYYKLQQK